MSTDTAVRSTTQREQAEQALVAVVEQFSLWTQAIHLPAEDGKPELHLTPVCPMPSLVEDWDGEGRWGIIWVDGPDYWAHRVNPISGFNIEVHSPLAVILTAL